MRARFTILLAFIAAPAFADEGAMDYRHHTMEAIGGHMEALVDILRGKVAHTGHLAVHAGNIANLAAITGTLFPEGSASDHASADIWENPEDFAERIAAFEEAANGLRDTIAAAGELGPAVQSLGQACKGCHDNYREE